MRQFTDSELIETAKNSSSAKDFCTKLGYKSISSYTKFIKQRLEKLGARLPKTPCHRYSNEEVIAAATKAHSVTDVMVKLGLTPTGYGHARFRARLTKLGIDVMDFPQRVWNKNKKIGHIHPIDYYLVKDGPHINTCALKKRLVSANLKEDKCEECDQGNVWNGKPLHIHLDHINGHKTDNRLQNLRMLCPNCHTQTETYSRIKGTVVESGRHAALKRPCSQEREGSIPSGATISSRDSRR